MKTLYNNFSESLNALRSYTPSSAGMFGKASTSLSSGSNHGVEAIQNFASAAASGG